MFKKLLEGYLEEKHPEKMDAIMNGDEAMTKDMEDAFWGWVDTRNA